MLCTPAQCPVVALHRLPSICEAEVGEILSLKMGCGVSAQPQSWWWGMLAEPPCDLFMLPAEPGQTALPIPLCSPCCTHGNPGLSLLHTLGFTSETGNARVVPGVTGRGGATPRPCSVCPGLQPRSLPGKRVPGAAGALPARSRAISPPAPCTQGSFWLRAWADHGEKD